MDDVDALERANHHLKLDDFAVGVPLDQIDTVDRDPVDLARELADRGAGEILLQSVERDGTMTGYDLEAIRLVSRAVSIPVIASGGAGSYAHLLEALTYGEASAVAAASMFHFTEQTPREAKDYLGAHGIAVRR